MPRKMKKKAEGGAAAPGGKADLFAGDGDGGGGGGGGLSINSRFASAFEDRKRKQDLERAAELGLFPRGAGEGGGEGSEGESEVSEDEGEQLDPALDRQITAVIQAIRARDPKMYQPGVHFFGGGGGEAAPAASEPAPAPRAKAKKGKSAQEVVAAQLVAAAEAGREDAFEEDEELAAAHGRRAVDDGNRSANARLYNEEQRELRDAFLSSAAGAGEAEDDGLLRVKPKSRRQLAAEEEESRVTREELLRAMASRKGGAAAHADELADPDKFLTTFMQSSMWRDAEREGEEEEEEEAEPEKEEVSEEELDKAEEFEAK
jgi:protein KRI1